MSFNEYGMQKPLRQQGKQINKIFHGAWSKAEIAGFKIA